MPAPSLADLLAIETQVESVFGPLLTSALLPAVVPADATEDLGVPRVEVVATVTQDGPHEAKITSGTYAGRWLYDQFAVSVDVNLITDGTRPGTDSDMRAALRVALLQDVQQVNTLFQSGTYLEIASYALTGGVRDAVADDGTLVTSGTIVLQVFIRASEYPL